MLIIIQATSWKWQFCVTSMITVELTRYVFDNNYVLLLQATDPPVGINGE